jgi:alpha-mannosidase
MRLEVNFDERFTLLQLPVFLPHGMTGRMDAVPGGAISRPLCRTEYPMQGWSRLEFPDHDLALVTQDAFSLSVTQETWQVTLLRSPRMAWPGSDPPIYHHRDYFTDQGVHTLHFELHADARLTDAELNLAARRMAQPLISFERTERADRPF